MMWGCPADEATIEQSQCSAEATIEQCGDANVNVGGFEHRGKRRFGLRDMCVFHLQSSASRSSRAPKHIIPIDIPLTVVDFNRWHTGQYMYDAHDDDNGDIPGVRLRASVWCRVCNVTFSPGMEASHGSGRRHTRQTLMQSIPDTPFCPGRAGRWGCHIFCRCGRFWPAIGDGQRPHLYFQNPAKVFRPDYDDDEGKGDTLEEGHRKLVCQMATQSKKQVPPIPKVAALPVAEDILERLVAAANLKATNAMLAAVAKANVAAAARQAAAESEPKAQAEAEAQGKPKPKRRGQPEVERKPKAKPKPQPKPAPKPKA
jgi:hypothetical protein